MGSCLSTSDAAPAAGGGSSPARLGSRRRGKKGGRRSSSSRESKEEESLSKIPGRMFVNGASGVASLFTQQGRKGINQDAMIVWEVCIFPLFCLYNYKKSNNFECSLFLKIVLFGY